MKNKPTPPELLLNTRTALLFFELSYEEKKTMRGVSEHEA